MSYRLASLVDDCLKAGVIPFKFHRYVSRSNEHTIEQRLQELICSLANGNYRYDALVYMQKVYYNELRERRLYYQKIGHTHHTKMITDIIEELDIYRKEVRYGE